MLSGTKANMDTTSSHIRSTIQSIEKEIQRISLRDKLMEIEEMRQRQLNKEHDAES